MVCWCLLCWGLWGTVLLQSSTSTLVWRINLRECCLAQTGLPAWRDGWETTVGWHFFFCKKTHWKPSFLHQLFYFGLGFASNSWSLVKIFHSKGHLRSPAKGVQRWEKKTAPPIAPKDYQHPTIGKTRIPSFFNSSPWKITMLLSSVNHLFRLGPSIPKCPIEIDGLPINSMVIFHGELWVITRV